MNSYLLSYVRTVPGKKKEYRKITAAVSGILKGILRSLETYREIFNTSGILKKALKWNSPACNSSFLKSSTALYTGKTSIATEAVFTDAVF